MYGEYLSQYGNELDPISMEVAQHAAYFLRFIFPEVSVIVLPDEPVADIRYDWFSLVKVIEGCNAVSIFILFLSFIFSFKGKWKQYVWFIPAGALFLHISNVFRIVLIGYVFYFHRTYTTLFHDFVFPGILYGSVLILWILWVKFLVNGTSR